MELWELIFLASDFVDWRTLWGCLFIEAMVATAIVLTWYHGTR